MLQMRFKVANFIKKESIMLTLLISEQNLGEMALVMRTAPNSTVC